MLVIIKQKMMYALKDNKEWIELKATLQFVEDKILRITDNHSWMMKKEREEDAEVLHYEDDDDYGSNFPQMIDAITWTEDLEIHSCYTLLGEKPEPDHLDNSGRWSWAEGCLDVPQLNGIGVCFAVLAVCTHKSYSVRHVLRIVSFSVMDTMDGIRSQMV